MQSDKRAHCRMPQRGDAPAPGSRYLCYQFMNMQQFKQTRNPGTLAATNYRILTVGKKRAANILVAKAHNGMLTFEHG